MKKYSVVGFTHEEGQPVEVIPSQWVINNSTCLWPSEEDLKAVKNMIIKCIPADYSWEKVPIKIYAKSSK